MNAIDSSWQKMHHFIDDTSVAHSHPAVYRMETGRRLVAGIPGGDADILKTLIVQIEGPFFLLFVLHTPRGEADAGRYQSPPIDTAVLSQWINRFSDFLRADARFDLWVHSAAENATLVWDRHNLLFAYGPIDRFEMSLLELGFVEGDAVVPTPHEHHYRPKCDEDSKALLASFDWSWSPLKPEDEQ
jgi:hypothetical protein